MKIPVVRGRIGSWIYYTGVMTFGQIAEKIKPSINQIYKATCLDDVLQRELTSNYENIKKYILKDQERFFNAIIIAIYNGNPQWLEVEFDAAESAFTNVGFLELTGDETLFPVDGQHRVAGIIAAINENPEIENEQVPVIFIAHSDTEAGRKKTRKLFSTLNRRAKPVGANENIALDEDDISSIITRDLLQDVPLCMKDNIVNSQGKQIPTANEAAFTSLIALYQSVDIIIKDKLKDSGISGNKFREYKLYRPSDETLESIREYVLNFINEFIEQTDVIKSYLQKQGEDRAKSFRNNNGGNFLFRPLVLTEYFEAIITIKRRAQDRTFEEIFGRFNDIQSDISLAPWRGLVWDGSKIIARAPKTVIRLVLIYMADSSLLTTTEHEKLIQEYAKCLNISEQEARSLLMPAGSEP